MNDAYFIFNDTNKYLCIYFRNDFKNLPQSVQNRHLSVYTIYVYFHIICLFITAQL